MIIDVKRKIFQEDSFNKAYKACLKDQCKSQVTYNGNEWTVGTQTSIPDIQKKFSPIKEFFAKFAHQFLLIFSKKYKVKFKAALEKLNDAYNDHVAKVTKAAHAALVRLARIKESIEKDENEVTQVKDKIHSAELNFQQADGQKKQLVNEPPSEQSAKLSNSKKELLLIKEELPGYLEKRAALEEAIAKKKNTVKYIVVSLFKENPGIQNELDELEGLHAKFPLFRNVPLNPERLRDSAPFEKALQAEIDKIDRQLEESLRPREQALHNHNLHLEGLRHEIEIQRRQLRDLRENIIRQSHAEKELAKKFDPFLPKEYSLKTDKRLSSHQSPLSPPEISSPSSCGPTSSPSPSPSVAPSQPPRAPALPALVVQFLDALEKIDSPQMRKLWEAFFRNCQRNGIDPVENIHVDQNEIRLKLKQKLRLYTFGYNGQGLPDPKAMPEGGAIVQFGDKHGRIHIKKGSEGIKIDGLSMYFHKPSRENLGARVSSFTYPLIPTWLHPKAENMHINKDQATGQERICLSMKVCGRKNSQEGSYDNTLKAWEHDGIIISNDIDPNDFLEAKRREFNIS